MAGRICVCGTQNEYDATSCSSCRQPLNSPVMVEANGWTQRVQRTFDDNPPAQKFEVCGALCINCRRELAGVEDAHKHRDLGHDLLILEINRAFDPPRLRSVKRPGKAHELYDSVSPSLWEKDSPACVRSSGNAWTETTSKPENQKGGD